MGRAPQVKIARIIGVSSLALVVIGLWYFYPAVWLAILTCLPLMLVLILLHGERIDIFSGRRLGPWIAAKGNALAITGAFIIPGRLTELFKPIYFNQLRSISLAEGLSIVMVERIYDIAAVMIMGMGALFLLPGSETGLLNFSKYFAVAGLLLFFGMLLLVLRYPAQCTRFLQVVPEGRVRNFMLSTFTAFRQSMMHGAGVWQIFLTLIVWTGSWLLYWIFLQWDGGADLAVRQALIVFLVGTLGLTITVTPGGLGTFEAAVTLVLRHYGYDLESAISSALGLRVVALLPNALLASYTIYADGFDIMRARGLAKSVGASNDIP